MNTKEILKIVKTGKWLYDGEVEMPVDIIALDYDFWYEIGKADDDLEEGEVPGPFDKDGYMYYVRFKDALRTDQVGHPDSLGHRTIEEAVAYAEEKLSKRIRWDN